jgi:hypothetical protein
MAAGVVASRPSGMRAVLHEGAENAVFATVRLRTNQTKGSGSRTAGQAIRRFAHWRTSYWTQPGCLSAWDIASSTTRSAFTVLATEDQFPGNEGERETQLATPRYWPRPGAHSPLGAAAEFGIGTSNLHEWRLELEIEWSIGRRALARVQ